MQNKLLKKRISALGSRVFLTTYIVNFPHPPPPEYNQNWLPSFKLLESLLLRPSETTHLIGQTKEIKIFKFRIRIVDQHFIEESIATTVEKKVIIPPVVQSQLLVELSAKPTVELFMSYPEALVNTIEQKA